MGIITFAVFIGVLTWVGLYEWDRDRESRIFRLVKQKDQEAVADAGKEERAVSDTGEEMLIRYSEYTLSSKERCIYFALAWGFMYLVGYIFFKHHLAAAILALLSFYYPQTRRSELIHKRKQELKVQFKQSLYALSSCLMAGKSIENSLRDVVKDLRLLYADPNTFIIREIEMINKKVANGDSVEKAFLDFSRRADIDDIRNFAEVFVTCKRTGGDLVEVIRRTSNIIGDKIDTQQEIYLMVAQKRFESKVISVIPFVIVAFLSFSSPEYMNPLYTGAGYVLMAAALLLLIACSWFTRLIMNIRV